MWLTVNKEGKYAVVLSFCPKTAEVGEKVQEFVTKNEE